MLASTWAPAWWVLLVTRCENDKLIEFQLRDEFEESVDMSTYLVAFVVCDYTHITQHTKRGISVSVYSPKDLISQADFALKTASAMMDHYADFFGVPYALPKLG